VGLTELRTSDPTNHSLSRPDLLRLRAPIASVVRYAGAGGEKQGDDEDECEEPALEVDCMGEDEVEEPEDFQPAEEQLPTPLVLRGRRSKAPQMSFTLSRFMGMQSADILQTHDESTGTSKGPSTGTKAHLEKQRTCKQAGAHIGPELLPQNLC